jgi:hypothetical protein
MLVDGLALLLLKSYVPLDMDLRAEIVQSLMLLRNHDRASRSSSRATSSAAIQIRRCA